MQIPYVQVRFSSERADGMNSAGRTFCPQNPRAEHEICHMVHIDAFIVSVTGLVDVLEHLLIRRVAREWRANFCTAAPHYNSPWDPRSLPVQPETR